MSDPTESKATESRPMKWWQVILGIAVFFLIPWLLWHAVDETPLPQVVNGQPPAEPFPFNLLQKDSSAVAPPAVPNAGRQSLVGRWTTGDLSGGVPATLTLAFDGSLSLQVGKAGGDIATGAWTVDGNDLSLWINKDGLLRPWNVAKILSSTSFSVTDRTGANAVFTRAR